MDINRDERSITPEDFRRIREVFESALERPVHERKAFVAEACESNTAMIRELELMLAAEQESDRLFDRSAPSNARPGLCPSCKSEIAAADRFCRFCGTPTIAEHAEEGRFRAGAHGSESSVYWDVAAWEKSIAPTIWNWASRWRSSFLHRSGSMTARATACAM